MLFESSACHFNPETIVNSPSTFTVSEKIVEINVNNSVQKLVHRKSFFLSVRVRLDLDYSEVFNLSKSLFPDLR